MRSQNVLDRQFDSTGLAFISDEQAEGLRGVALQEGDVLLNITGDGVTFARSCQVPVSALPAVVNQHVAIVRANTELVEPGYVLAFLTHPSVKDYIEGFNAGGSRRAITKAHIENFRLPLPSIAEQRAIARILGTLDEKIELNRQINDSLEAVALTFFQSWLIDFDPVRAKASGETAASICQRLGVNAELLAQFPDRFEDSELGQIPQGWLVRGLDDIASYLNGLALQKYPAKEQTPSLPVIKIAQLRAGHTFNADRACIDIPVAYVIEDGDVLFSWSGSLEVDLWCGGRGALNQHLFKVTSDEFPKWFYLLWIRQHLNAFRDIAANKATTMGHIQRKHLSEAKALCPPQELIAEMSKVFSPLLGKIISTKLESAQLETLRDTLLPQLLSGRLSVTAEKGVS
ncbi:MAG: restriction endonuclease subunit S [Nitrospira sp.]|nr:restriction endonuclease subunit S [Nitrospira sp.]